MKVLSLLIISGIDRFAELAARCTFAYKKQTGRDLVNFGPGSLPDGDSIPVAYEQALLYYDKSIEEMALDYDPRIK